MLGSKWTNRGLACLAGAGGGADGDESRFRPVELAGHPGAGVHELLEIPAWSLEGHELGMSALIKVKLKPESE